MLRLIPLLALVLAPSALAQGVLRFEATVHEFGTIDEGTQAEHTFAFTNAGDAPLALADVRPSCGCTAPTFTTEAVAPGETGEITVVFDSNGRPGPFQKRIAVRTATETVALQITGTVVPTFAATGVAQGHFLFEADAWESAPLAPGEALQHAFQFQNTADGPLRILSVATPPGVEAVTRNTIIFPGNVAAVMLVVEDPAALADADGRIDIPVLVETNDEARPTKTLQLLASLQPAGAEPSGGTD